MELTLKPSTKNTYPLKALLIRSAEVRYWVQELQRMHLSLSTAEVFPVPGLTANSVWGCLVIPAAAQKITDSGKHEWCQQMHPHVFIAERAVLHPMLTEAELERLFGAGKCVVHPEFGFVELGEKVAFESLLQLPKIVSLDTQKPRDSVFIPQRILSFRIQPVPVEEALQNLEQSVVPQKETFTDKPLSLLEKVKLFLYQKTLFRRSGKSSSKESTSPDQTREPSRFAQFLEKVIAKLTARTPQWMQSVQEDYEELEKRSQKQIEKLMDLLKKDPAEALKYAIPLDDNGMNRGSSQPVRMDWSTRWSDFSLFSRDSSGGGSIDIGDQCYELVRQYQETAQKLLDQKDYQKAAFVYMKLLKNYQAAAQALESGRYYQEAAAVYLNYGKDKRKAAECYEKGSMTLEAIDLYKELDEAEKVGDLYSSLRKKKDAEFYYLKAISKLTLTHQYVKASLIYRHKMDNFTDGQTMLLEGWRNEKDAFNCMNNYLANIQDVKQLRLSIETVYQQEIQDSNREVFLQVLEYEYGKHTDLQSTVREIAYEIVATQLDHNPKVVLHLEKFNPDKQLSKDLMNFHYKHRQRK